MKSLEKKIEKLKQDQAEWEKEKEYLQEKKAFSNEKKEFYKSSNKKTTMMKILTWFLFISCMILEIVVIIITFKTLTLATIIMVMPDFAPLISLIGIVVGQVVGLAVYAVKSMKENSQGGIVYEMAMHSQLDAPPEEKKENEKSVG